MLPYKVPGRQEACWPRVGWEAGAQEFVIQRFSSLLTVQERGEARLGTTVPISNSAKRNLSFYDH